MVSWLGAGGLVLVFWWMELDLVSLKGNARPSSLFWVSWFGMSLGTLSANGQVKALIDMKHLPLDLAGLWMGLGVSVEMEAFENTFTY